ncbi:MAG TPA: acetate/propionate family kinase [Burkholderiaceae bacterium]|nr:acetate/propionate family kinase [Burkholderiaceae bacterium]
MAILVINAGSSSLKFALYPVVDRAVKPTIFVGCIEGLEPGGHPHAKWNETGKVPHAQDLLCPAGSQPFDCALAWLQTTLAALSDHPALDGIAHRVVHGGHLQNSVIVTPDILETLEQFNSLAPLHQPHNIAGIRHFAQIFPDVPQIACFDTVYHRTIPELNYRLPLPESLTRQGIRRYGFHGLSYQYIMSALQQHSARANDRVLMAHLGNGASLCAALNGCSQASTMGFSALDGLMMGTRSGSLDAGVLLYLLEQGWNSKQLEDLLYRQSGLLGVSGLSADMRRLRAADTPRARLAIDMFVSGIVREAGGMVACLGGLDVLAFSGGIGERDAQTRLDVCRQLKWLGVRIDAESNAQAVSDQIMPIHAPDSTVEIWAIPTDEGLVGAREAADLLFGAHASRPADCRLTA